MVTLLSTFITQNVETGAPLACPEKERAGRDLAPAQDFCKELSLGAAPRGEEGGLSG
jgi:hypothetical protein